MKKLKNTYYSLDVLNHPGKLMYLAVRGSQAYGTAIDTSDVDSHGIYMVDTADYLSLKTPKDQVQDKKGDTVYYELKRYMYLAMNANPNLIDMLWTPKDCVIYKDKKMDELIKNRNLFMTKKCYNSFTGYAIAQIKKAKGKNKKVNSSEKFFNEEGMVRLQELFKTKKVSSEWVANRFSSELLGFLTKYEDFKFIKKFNTKYDSYLEEECLCKLLPPSHEDYCYVLPRTSPAVRGYDVKPFRFIPLKDTRRHGVKLDDCIASSVEHIPGMYRIYDLGWDDEVKTKNPLTTGGVNCSSISKDGEWRDYTGVLYFNESGYKQGLKEYHSYWEWMANRNDDRWKDQEDNNIEYDVKNMQHTVRLLLCGKNILVNGEPIIRFEGEQLKFLREIRENKYSYDYLISYAENLDEELKTLRDKCSLPNSPDMEAIDSLYKQIINV